MNSWGTVVKTRKRDLVSEPDFESVSGAKEIFKMNKDSFFSRTVLLSVREDL